MSSVESHDVEGLNVEGLAEIVRRDGFALVRGAEMQDVLRAHGSLADRETFANSWNDLGLDTYMADGGRYRKRRHAAFAADAAGIRRKPNQAHYQSRDYNSLNGGIARWFDPILPEIGAGPTMTAILGTCRTLFELQEGRGTAPAGHIPAGHIPAWHIEVHQFRIEARTGEAGKPTPEGTHQDGVDHVLVLLVDRQNIQSGVTTITDLARRPLGSFTLTEPFDSALVDDNRVMHGVTPVQPLDPSGPGHRDVLVVTFRRA